MSTATTSTPRAASRERGSRTARARGGAPAGSRASSRSAAPTTAMSVDWDRNIAEIFAEDYARLARPGSRHRIPWLEEPNESVLAAILHDLGLGPEPDDLDAAAAEAARTRPQRQARAEALGGASRSACSAPAGASARRSRSPAPPPRRPRAPRAPLRRHADLDAHARQGDEGRQHRPTEPRPRRELRRDADEHQRRRADLRPLAPTLGLALAQRLPRSACSRSIDSKRALKFPSPNVVAPWRSITSKKSVGRSCAVFVKICSR